MREVSISEFKATCCAVVERVRKTRTPVRITRFGKTIAEIVPLSPKKRVRRRLGSMVGTGRIIGDIVGPTGSLDDWEAWRD